MANKVNLIPVIGSGQELKYIATVSRSDKPTAAIKSTRTKANKAEDRKQSDWAFWGDGNNYPHEVMEDLRKSSIIKRAFGELARIHVGSGPIYGYTDIDDNGSRYFVPMLIPEIEDFLESTNAFETQRELALDLETLYNAFPEFIWNKAHTKIVDYNRQKAVHARLGKQNTQAKIKMAYFSADWPRPEDNKLTKVFLDDGSSETLKKFCCPLKYPSADEGVYYSLPDWDAIRQNGWLDVAELVPNALKCIYQNQAIVKYQIKVPSDYFPTCFADWENLKTEEQNSKKADLEKKLTSFLSDVKNYGKSLITYESVNSSTGEIVSGIEFKLIESSNLGKDGNFLVDAAAANAEILMAVGLPLTLTGVGVPGARASQGSGSYVREELWRLQATKMSDREISLKPLRIISKANNWDQYAPTDRKLVWRYGDVSTLQTLNKNPEGKEETILGE